MYFVPGIIAQQFRERGYIIAAFLSLALADGAQKRAI